MKPIHRRLYIARLRSNMPMDVYPSQLLGGICRGAATQSLNRLWLSMDALLTRNIFTPIAESVAREVFNEVN